MKSVHRTKRRVLAGVFVAAAAAMVLPVAASAKPGPQIPQRACDQRDNNSYSKLLECVRLDGVREHQAALQAIADANGGTRADQTQGHLDSVDYVYDTMTAAGWDVEKVPFEYPAADILVEQTAPTPAAYEANDAIETAEGDVTAGITAVDVNLTLPRDPVTSGCEPGDFADFAAGNIALLQRGTCTFGVKVANAEAAGASAVIIFNQGNTPGRTALDFRPTLGFNATVPVVAVSYPDGEALAAATSAHVKVDFFTATSYNVIADLHGVNDSNVVMAGAHLDSVPAGPGINDNGSGSAVLLELGQQLGHHVPQNTIRFAWWGAEELGLLGSTAWVDQQDEASLGQIALYMNFDMVGSPNYIFMVYDANQSTFPAPVDVPPGSEDIEATFESFYTWSGVPYDDTEFSGRSDYQAFIENGIPSSGLFTGAEEHKTEAQAAIWGGEWDHPGDPSDDLASQLDPCYHLACDTYANNDDHALDVNADAVAFAVLKYSYSTESVNGVPGVPVPGKFTVPAPAGPEGTFA
jgi:Zn-dependent M28 family amino/carboxypeptidase